MYERMIKIVLFGVFLFSLANCSESSKKAGTPKELQESQASKEVKKESIQEKAIVPLDRETTAPASSVYTPIGESEFVKKSFAFLEQNKAHYKITNPRAEFVLKGEINDNGWCTVVLDQVNNGVKVENGYFSINFRHNGPLTFNNIIGFYDPEARKINSTPAISEEQAKSIALNDPKHKDARPEISSIELLIGRIDGELRLFWSIGLINGGGIGSWNYKIDAQTGKVLVCESALLID